MGGYDRLNRLRDIIRYRFLQFRAIALLWSCSFIVGRMMGTFISALRSRRYHQMRICAVWLILMTLFMIQKVIPSVREYLVR